MQVSIRARVVPALLSVIVALTALSTDRIQADIVSGAVHNWDAALDTDGNTMWEDTGTAANRNWSLFGPTGPNASGPARMAVTSAATTITHAYDFDGTDDIAGAAAENRAGNHDTTFEVWFKPDGFPTGAARTIFEHGNGPRGVTLGLNGKSLVYAFDDTSSFGMVTYDLDLDNNGIDNPDFIQAAIVVDDTNNQIRLYVDGQVRQSASLTSVGDFSSNDGLGLGANEGQGGGAQDDTGLTWGGYLDGKIGVVREYRQAFGSAEVQQNFQALAVPEPAGLLLAAIAGLIAIAFVPPKRVG